MIIEVIYLIAGSLIVFLLYYILFIAEVFSGIGWFSFSVKDVSLKIRLLCFLLFILSMIFAFATNRLVASILGVIGFCLLILCR